MGFQTDMGRGREEEIVNPAIHLQLPLILKEICPT